MKREAGGWGSQPAGCALLAAACLFIVSGCTSRGITITSLPEGAEVSINHRVVGNTPIRVAFNHYGTYRLELRKEKYQTLVREENVHPPAYGWDPGALIADNLIPARLNDEVYLHFVMKPLEEKADKEALSERDALLQRAELARAGTVTNPRTGEQSHIELTHAPAPRATEVGDEEEAAASSEVASKSILDKPPTLQSAVKEITTAKPEGSRLAKEYNVELEPPDKRGAFISPDEADKAVATRVNRTPKDEELIYAEPPSVDKGAKRSGTEGKKDGK